MSEFFAKGAARVWRGTIDIEAVTLKAVLIKSSYVKDTENHEFYSDISAHISSTPQTLTGVTVVGRTLDADDPVFPAVGAGHECEALGIFVDTGNPATSPLLLYINDPAAFPFTGNGDDQTFPWSNGTYKIVSL